MNWKLPIHRPPSSASCSDTPEPLFPNANATVRSTKIPRQMPSSAILSVYSLPFGGRTVGSPDVTAMHPGQ